MSEFDLDGSGEVDLTEFIYVIAMQRKSDFSKKDVLRCATVHRVFVIAELLLQGEVSEACIPESSCSLLLTT